MVDYVHPQQPLQGRVHLTEPDPEWQRQYAEVAGRIRRALTPLPVVVEHVGSTSVPGLAAKPIIDVLLLVPDPVDETTYVPSLETTGFLLHLREPDWFEHRLLKGSHPDVNLHVFAVGSEEAQRMVLFRDHLRTDASDRELYAATKRCLAARDWEHVQDYADAKSEVVAAILTRARANAT
jgi:GrpB-like predicted nucleotidyltransferase (UPF0157 family)